jgi:hypothetical protein
VNKSKVNGTPGLQEHFRRLKPGELVSLGDFVASEAKGFELWEGPSGFRADSFVKPIYRRDDSHSSAKKELE